MFFDFSQIDGASRYKLMTATITPRPIAWVCTLSDKEIINLAPYSFFNMLGHTPPTVVLGCTTNPHGTIKDTPRNILATGEFVINLVADTNSDAMNLTAINAPASISEAELAEVRLKPSTFISPPRVEGAPVSFECKLFQAIHPGPLQTIIIGEVLGVHIKKSAVLDESRAYIDTQDLQTIGRMGGAGFYTKTGDQFRLDRPKWQDQEKP